MKCTLAATLPLAVGNSKQTSLSRACLAGGSSMKPIHGHYFISRAPAAPGAHVHHLNQTCPTTTEHSTTNRIKLRRTTSTKMTTTMTTVSNCDLFSLPKDDNSSVNKSFSSRIRTKRRIGRIDMNANGFICLLISLFCCFCCLISASSGFVIPPPQLKPESSSHSFHFTPVSSHGSLPTQLNSGDSQSVPNISNNNSNKSSHVGLSASSSSVRQQRLKRHILPAQPEQQQHYHHHHHPKASSHQSPSWDSSESQLPINVRNNGGEVFRQLISSNIDADYIRLEYTDTDGSLVRTLVDFRNNLQIFRLVRLGEQDLNERRWTTYCFITLLPPNEYISADAMSKLTQKNPATIRQAELDHGSALYSMDLKLREEEDSERRSLYSLLSPHLKNFCEHAQGRIYASEEDLVKWRTFESGPFPARSFANVSSLFSRLNPPSSLISQVNSSSLVATAAAPPVQEFRQCGELLAKLYQNFTSRINTSSSSEQSSPPLFHHRSFEELARFLAAYQGELCHCSLSLVLPFYPCSVRHCTAPDPSNPEKMVSYRCGIRTCRRRYEFRFAVADKLACLADFDPTLKLAAAGDVLDSQVLEEEREVKENPPDSDNNKQEMGDGEADPPVAAGDNSAAANSKQV